MRSTAEIFEPTFSLIIIFIDFPFHPPVFGDKVMPCLCNAHPRQYFGCLCVVVPTSTNKDQGLYGYLFSKTTIGGFSHCSTPDWQGVLLRQLVYGFWILWGSKSKPGQSVIAEGISLAPLEPYTIFSGTLFHYSEQTMRVYGLNLAGWKSIIYSEEKTLRQTRSLILNCTPQKRFGAVGNPWGIKW